MIADNINLCQSAVDEGIIPENLYPRRENSLVEETRDLREPEKNRS